MANKSKTRTSLRCLVGVMIFGLGALFAIASQSPQAEPENNARRLWNKRFEEARNKAKRPTPPSPSPKPTATDGELIGVTIWRLRPATAKDGANAPRELVQGIPNQLLAERTAADTEFKENELVRLSIEVPRAGNSYLYVIDREVYADGKLGDPSLIFPTSRTRGGDNVVTAGKVMEIPAPHDAIPFFYIKRSRPDHVSERLTIRLVATR